MGVPAWGDESGLRLGNLLATYAGVTGPIAELRYRRIRGNPSDEEVRAVLTLLEGRMGKAALVERIRLSAYSIASLRLRVTQSFLALMDLLLDRSDVGRVLARNVTQLRERNIYGFIANRAVRDTFFCLPAAFFKKDTARAVWNALEAAIAEEGYPLATERTEEIVVALVPELAEALAKVRSFRQKPACSQSVANDGR